MAKPMASKATSKRKKAKSRSFDRVEMGAVIVTSGPHRGRIGDYDDDGETDGGRSAAVVYFGTMYTSAPRLIPYGMLRGANERDLRKRREELEKLLFPAGARDSAVEISREHALIELLLVERELNDRLSDAVFASMKRDPALVVISLLFARQGVRQRPCRRPPDERRDAVAGRVAD
ncbi:hypothetical protein [Labilithrix luteola]|uniref:hypothetical protein n=1 Tax=Labilithrix luteola TaxID=1391654 RepID=UPI0011BAB072|nr:hypothetical protein [Labilithrix luteola]